MFFWCLVDTKKEIINILSIIQNIYNIYMRTPTKVINILKERECISFSNQNFERKFIVLFFNIQKVYYSNAVLNL